MLWSQQRIYSKSPAVCSTFQSFVFFSKYNWAHIFKSDYNIQRSPLWSFQAKQWVPEFILGCFSLYLFFTFRAICSFPGTDPMAAQISFCAHIVLSFFLMKKYPWFCTFTLAFTISNSFLLIVLPCIQPIPNVTKFLGGEPDAGLRALCVLSLLIPQPSFRESILLFPFPRWGIWSLKKWTNFSRLHSGVVRLQVQVFWFQSQYFIPSSCIELTTWNCLPRAGFYGR